MLLHRSGNARARLSRRVGCVPICLATVPFAIGYERSGIPEDHWRSGQSFRSSRTKRRLEIARLIADRRVTTRSTLPHEDFRADLISGAPDPNARSHGCGIWRRAGPNIYGSCRRTMRCERGSPQWIGPAETSSDRFCRSGDDAAMGLPDAEQLVAGPSISRVDGRAKSIDSSIPCCVTPSTRSSVSQLVPGTTLADGAGFEEARKTAAISV